MASSYSVVESIENIWDEALRDNQLFSYNAGFNLLQYSVDDTLTQLQSVPLSPE